MTRRQSSDLDVLIGGAWTAEDPDGGSDDEKSPGEDTPDWE